MSVVFLVTGPSAVGKGRLIAKAMSEIDVLCFIPSYTTRAPRAGEIAGKHYFFCSIEEFELMENQGLLLETSGHYESKYGSPKLKYYEYMEDNLCPIKDIDVNGAMSFKEEFGDRAVTIYIEAPSFEVVKERMLERDGKLSQSRLSRYTWEESHKDRCDYVVMNDDFEKAFAEFKKILLQEILRFSLLEKEGVV